MVDSIEIDVLVVVVVPVILPDRGHIPRGTANRGIITIAGTQIDPAICILPAYAAVQGIVINNIVL